MNVNDTSRFPTVQNNYLDAIDINSGECMVLGASSLTGRYWLGSLWYYTNVTSAPDDEKCSAALETNSGVCDVKFITNRKVIAGLDSGCVCVCNLNEEFSEIHIDRQVEEHDNCVTSVSVTCDKQKAVSAAKDARIKVWDLSGLTSSASYKVNSDVVWCVACHPEQSEMFLSCSEDGRTLLWDTRNAKPAKVLDRGMDHIPTCLDWHPVNEYAAAVGTQDGNIAILDIRQDKETAKTVNVHSRSVHRLQYSKTRPEFLASASEDCTVAVTNVNQELIYRGTGHTDFVQGLCWNTKTNKLYSCGWDKQVLSHDVSVGDKNPISSMET